MPLPKYLPAMPFEILLKEEQAICPTHKTPLIHRLAESYPVFVRVGFQLLANWRQIDVASPEGQRELMTFLNLQPLCCQLIPGRLFAAYLRVQEELNLWSLIRCEYCLDEDFGFNLAGPICLECYIKIAGKPFRSL